MSSNNSLKSREVIGLIVRCVIGFVLAMFVTVYVLTLRPSPSTTQPARTTEGFDFAPILRSELGERPNIGDQIDLTRLKGRDGTPLANVIGDHLAMIVAVDNECGMCRIAADQMRYVCEQIAQAGVQYFFVSFTSPGPPSRFFEYIDSLKIDSPAFLWMKDEGQPPVTLSRMIVPSHILIDHTGVVKQVWLGGNDAKPIRDRMANQIVNDTLKALASGS